MGNQSQSQDLEHEWPPAREAGRNIQRQVQSQDVSDRSAAPEELEQTVEKPAQQPDQPQGPRRDTLGNESDVL